MSWESTLLGRMGAPDYAVGVEAFALWAQSEGMPAWTNNPLACGTRWPGSTAYNTAGVQVYPSQSAGMSALAWTLTHDTAYKPIAAAFRNGEGLVQLWLLINASPWCPKCQAGHYPIALWTAAGYPQSGVAAPPPATSAPVTAPANVATAWERLRTYAHTSFPAQMRNWERLTSYIERI